MPKQIFEVTYFFHFQNLNQLFVGCFILFSFSFSECVHLVIDFNPL